MSDFLAAMLSSTMRSNELVLIPPIVLLLENYNRELVVNSLRAGARGLFCLASMPFKSLCRCIISVHQGQYWTNTEQMSYVIDALSIGPSVRLINSRSQVVLTPREEKTVSLLHPFDAANSGSQFGTEQTSVGGFVS